MADEKEKKGLASYASLIGQIFAAAWVAVWSGIKFSADIQAVTMTDLIISGFTIAGCFTPVYFNMVMDKIKGIALCGTSSSD